MTISIGRIIQKAREEGPSSMLSLASSDTLDAVAAFYNVSPQSAAPKTAQMLFSAKKIAIKSKGQPGSRAITREYDLTNQMQACQALQTWGVQARSNAAWMMTGQDQNAYYTAAMANPETITRHVTTSLQLIRRNA